jgi:hypothetical protein
VVSCRCAVHAWLGWGQKGWNTAKSGRNTALKTIQEKTAF